MPIKLAVFDIAGTTVKDNHDVSKALQAAFLKSGYNVPLELIDPLMGYEKQQAIRQLLRVHEHNDAKITTGLVSTIHKEFVEQMLDWYKTTPVLEPLPNVEETFKKLHEKGIRVGINTGFSKDIANTIMDRLGWTASKLVDYVVASDEVESGRPYPDMMHKLMDEAGIHEPMEVAKIGDTEVDVREGQNTGCKYVVGVTTGIFTRKELEAYQPTHIIDDMAELTAILAK